MLNRSPSATRVGRDDVQAMLRVLQPLDGAAGDPIEKKRRLLADVCRFIGERMYGNDNGARVGADRAQILAADARHLSPRLQQTLASLLAGDSEKQAAARMGVSPHTVHVYVKALYRRYNVSSRGELLSMWVRR